MPELKGYYKWQHPSKTYGECLQQSWSHEKSNDDRADDHDGDDDDVPLRRTNSARDELKPLAVTFS